MKKQKNTEQLQSSSLRTYAKRRLLNDMVESVKKYSRFGDEYFILVFDTAALKVFSSCCQVFELIQIAKIYHIEQLEKKRKKYKKTDAIYCITPTQESIQKVVNDFKEEGAYQYGAVHLCFTSHVSDQLLLPIAQNKILAPRVASFSEINLDFYMFNESVFHLNLKNSLPLFKIIDDQPDFVEQNLFLKLRDQVTNKLLTVCTVYDEFPYIIYQGNSQLSKIIAKNLNNSLKEFYKRSKKVKPREPRGSLLIVDRSLDIISPVIHDYYYQNSVYDVLDVGENGKIKADNRTVFLNEQDDLWVRFRYQHLALVMDRVNKEVQKVLADSKKGRTAKPEEMNMEQMAALIRDMPKVEELMKNYQIHLDISNRIIADFQKNQKREIINLEQKIITGLNSKGASENNTKIVMEVSQLAKDITDIDYLRLLIVYFSCFELPTKDKSTMLKSLPDEKHRTIIKNLEYVNDNFCDKGDCKFKRRNKEHTKEQSIEYQRLSALSEFNILRTEPQLCTLIKQIHNQNIDKNAYPFVDEPNNQKKKDDGLKIIKGAGIKQETKDQSLLENPRIFVYMIGGLSHHEICSIAELQEQVKAQIIPGSNEIITCNQFLNQLEQLHKVDLKKIKQGDMADQEALASLLGLGQYTQEEISDIFNDDED